MKQDHDAEFGVPFPGREVPADQWTDCALPRLPIQGTLNPDACFGRQAPLVVDLGCGNGRYLIASALARPEYDHLGVDVLPMAIRYAVKRASRRGLRNVRFAVGDAADVVRRVLPAASVQELHLYHPQPYYDLADAPKRLVTAEFLGQVWAALAPPGLFVVQTDNPAYWHYLVAICPVFFEFTGGLGPWPDAPAGRTRREIRARQLGLPIFRGQGTPRRDRPLVELLAAAQRLPPPRFQADRRLQALDRQA